MGESKAPAEPRRIGDSASTFRGCIGRNARGAGFDGLSHRAPESER